MNIPDGVHHVTARGDGQKAIYMDDTDRRVFLACLRKATERFSWRCLSFCLMDNHYHLLVRTPLANLSDGMRQLNGTYAQRFNRRCKRRGSVFQDRFHDVLVQRDEHMLELARYIALNPVRAGICQQPEDWPWSSHRGMLGLQTTDSVAVAEMLSYFGGSRRRYLEFVNEPTRTKGFPPGPRAVYGDAEFRRARLAAVAPSPETPAREWKSDRPSLLEILDTEGDAGIVTAYREHGYRLREIAEVLGCHYSTVSRRLSMLEAGEHVALQDLTLLWRCKT
jgi:putative transposase